jgi:hypothetical protein
MTDMPQFIDPHRDTWAAALNASAFVISKQSC